MTSKAVRNPRRHTRVLRFWRAILAVVGLVACSGGDGIGNPDPGPADDSPRFDNVPPPSADHNRMWEYKVQVSDPNGDPVSVSVVEKPDWMEFDEAAIRLSGIAGWENVGTHRFRMLASDGSNSTTRAFTIDVVKGKIICNQDFGDPVSSEYVLPYPAGTTSPISQSYCTPNPAAGHHDWFAYDFDMPIGDTIVASRGGVVTAVRENFADGTRVCGEENWVFIGHVDGTRMSYVHITTNGALVKVGETVTQGQAIALSGDSGCSIGPHVHVALFRDNTDFSGRATLPLNYRNATGILDANRGLRTGEAYRARSP